MKLLSELKEKLLSELEKDCDEFAGASRTIEEIFDKAVEDTARSDGLIKEREKKQYIPEAEWF